VTKQLATIVVALALALCLVGCGPIVAPVKLLTYEVDSCHPAPAAGQLVADQRFGTALLDSSWGPLMPVAWPSGYTGRYAGGEIEVVAPDGHLVAVTGKRYELIGVGVDVGGTRALGACGAFQQ
jgi:hypothetical protein